MIQNQPRTSEQYNQSKSWKAWNPAYLTCLCRFSWWQTCGHMWIYVPLEPCPMTKFITAKAILILAWTLPIDGSTSSGWSLHKSRRGKRVGNVNGSFRFTLNVSQVEAATRLTTTCSPPPPSADIKVPVAVHCNVIWAPSCQNPNFGPHQTRIFEHY